MARRNLGGRKTKAEELGVLAARKKFLKGLPKIDGTATEESVMAFTHMLTMAMINGLITAAEMDRYNAAAGLTLRAIKQRRAYTEIDELEKMHAELKDAEARAAERSSAERGRTR
jgi:hypothetical protein